MLRPGEGPRAAIFELEDDRYFLRARKIDPKPALKKAFARTGRRLQCLRPAKLLTPPATPPQNTKKRPPAPYPGTRFTSSTILRASAAINDALRQLVRLGSYETPDTLPDLEQIGIWLHHSGSTRIPIVTRPKPGGAATAHLASAEGTPMPPLPYSDPPKALATGKGRIPGGKRQKAQVAHFLINALGAGDAVSHNTHDRVVFVRSASFRTWGWDWLQDKHIQPDQLVLPGADLGNDTDVPPALSPQDCPGLRIVRVRDRSSAGEVARGFAARLPDRQRPHQRAVQIHRPHLLLDQPPLRPDADATRRHQAQARHPPQLHPPNRQPRTAGDLSGVPATRRRPRRLRHPDKQPAPDILHTQQATLFPAPLHLCELADEYL